MLRNTGLFISALPGLQTTASLIAAYHERQDNIDEALFWYKRAAKNGDKVTMSLGFSHPVEIIPSEGIELEVPANNRLIVKGIDKEKVGIFAAKIRDIRKPEPYKGKGVRYENERVRQKVGKTGKK